MINIIRSQGCSRFFFFFLLLLFVLLFLFLFLRVAVCLRRSCLGLRGRRGLGLQRTASSSVVALSDPTAVSALCVEVAAAYCTHLFALALLLSLLRRLLRGFLGRLRLVLFGTHRLRYVAATTCLLFRRKKAGAKSRRVVNVGAGRRPADEQQE